MKKLILSISIGLILSTGACTASTQTPTNSEGAATLAQLPTATSTPQPTVVSTATPDLRVFDIDPKNLLLGLDDLPLEGNYSSFSLQPVKTSEVVSSLGTMGDEYLAKSGRIAEWDNAFNQEAKLPGPHIIESRATLYKTSQGAQYSLGVYSMCHDASGFFKIIETEYKVGDISIVCTALWEKSGGNEAFYMIDFTYRNIEYVVLAHGTEDEVTPEFVQGISEKLLQRLETQPLSETVTFVP